jgi:hypothetical protein
VLILDSGDASMSSKMGRKSLSRSPASWERVTLSLASKDQSQCRVALGNVWPPDTGRRRKGRRQAHRGGGLVHRQTLFGPGRGLGRRGFVANEQYGHGDGPVTFERCALYGDISARSEDIV